MARRPAPLKTEDQYFADWEGHVFGYGYGSGEEHVLGALRRFFELVPLPDEHGSGAMYNHPELEKELPPEVVWLLINVLAHASIIEYGTSPRYGWLSQEGQALQAYMRSRTLEQLWQAVESSWDPDYFKCYPDACNCGPGGHDKNLVCQNPFWECR